MKNYRGNSRSCRPYRGQYNGRRPYRGPQQRGRGQQNNYRGQFQSNCKQFNPFCGSYNNITMAVIRAEVAMAMVVTFIDHVIMEEAITEAITIINTINITHMMMEPSLNNMVHHALFVEVSIILLNIASRGNMTSIIL